MADYSASPVGAESGFEGEGFSLLRNDEAMPVLRKRLERPARMGGIALTLLGVVCAGAGAALWVTGGVRTPTPLALGITLFGILLITLGVVQFRLVRRDAEHWPNRAVLWDGGLELELNNGDVRGASWSDPDLALNLVSRKARAPVNREFLLIWLRDSKVPSIELSAEGFAKVRQTAEDHRLAVKELRAGTRSDAAQWIEIRPNVAAKMAAAAAESSDAVSS
jgi:hypothetical protein